MRISLECLELRKRCWSRLRPQQGWGDVPKAQHPTSLGTFLSWTSRTDSDMDPAAHCRFSWLFNCGTLCYKLEAISKGKAYESFTLYCRITEAERCVWSSSAQGLCLKRGPTSELVHAAQDDVHLSPGSLEIWRLLFRLMMPLLNHSHQEIIIFLRVVAISSLATCGYFCVSFCWLS